MVNSPKHQTANETRMDKPLADNFRKLNMTLHFSIIHKQYIIWYIYIKYWETNPVKSDAYNALANESTMISS